MQRCGSCKAEKNEEDFSPSYRGKTGTWCRACFAAYARREREPAEHEPRRCTQCGTSYRPKQLHSTAAFCSRSCKDSAKNAASAERRRASKPIERICVHCGAVLPQSKRVDAMFCSEECNSAAHALKRKLRARGDVTEEPGYVRLQIAERDRWRCGICGGAVSKTKRWPEPQAGSLDHIVPVSEGGSSDKSNLRLTHLVCNLRRGNGGGGEQLALLG